VTVVDRVYARALSTRRSMRTSSSRSAPRSPSWRKLSRRCRSCESSCEIRSSTRVAKAAVLEDVLSGGEPLVRNFVLLLADRGRAGIFDDIAREFERLIAEHEGIVHAELTTAVELSDNEAKGLLTQIEQASGRKVEATRTVDPGLIGGIVLQIGSHRLDASVRGRLERLKRELATV